MKENSQPLVTFIILHYMTLEVTLKCVKSIQDLITYSNYQILIVDNGSSNGTGDKLIEKFYDNKKINVLCLKDNLGFSVGNNLGYRKAREQFHSEYIIILNNDVEIIQKDFIEKIIKCYEKDAFYVMGPDVINLEGSHQSPLRDHIITRKEVNSWLIKRKIFSTYLHVHKFLKLPPEFFIFKKYLKHSRKIREFIQTTEKKENVELQGACLIFSPLFISKNETAFEELTFLYCEESLLLLRCVKNDWKILYNPEIKIKHAEKSSTEIDKNIIEREIFCSDNYVKAIKVIRKYLTQV